jgi:hypothetical protein
MADTKISALTASTTPLAGTEVLPIVQSGTTKQVSVANLTAGRAVSALSQTITGNTTTLGASFSNAAQIFSGGTDNTKYSGTAFRGASAFNTFFGRIPGGDLVAIGTDSSGSFAPVMTWGVSSATLNIGDLIIGTSGRGIDFSATPGTGTSELLADYEEGTWTPTVTAAAGAITTVSASGNYTKIGRQVTVNMNISITDNGTGAAALLIGGVPFNAATTRFDAGVGREYSVLGLTVAMNFSATNTIQMLTYNNLYPGGTGYKIAASITYNV